MNNIQTKSQRVLHFGLTLCLISLLPFAAAVGQEVDSSPKESRISEKLLSEISPVIEAAIEAGEMPGAVVCIGRKDETLLLHAFGNRQLEPSVEPMTTDTIFDLASITKPVATATSVMVLVDQGKIDLDERVAKYLPAFEAEDKGEVTVRQLLLHEGGLIADNSMTDYQADRETSIENTLKLSLSYAPGSRFVYSDVGFIVLGAIVEELSQQRLDEFSADAIFKPLEMDKTRFNPPAEWRAKISPTEKRKGLWIRGDVHDPRAFAMNGVAGHAGLFSTAEDLAIYAQMLLGRGSRNDTQVLQDSTVETMTAAREVARGKRAYGWDKESPYSSNRSPLYSEQAFGHGGFTGTSLWIDPEHDLFVIFLSSRLHPDGKGSVNRLAAEIGTRTMRTLFPELESQDSITKWESPN